MSEQQQQSQGLSKEATITITVESLMNLGEYLTQRTARRNMTEAERKDFEKQIQEQSQASVTAARADLASSLAESRVKRTGTQPGTSTGGSKEEENK
jgi:hypothetical protein